MKKGVYDAAQLDALSILQAQVSDHLREVIWVVQGRGGWAAVIELSGPVADRVHLHLPVSFYYELGK